MAQSMTIGAESQEVLRRIRTAFSDVLQMMNVNCDDAATRWIGTPVACLMQHLLFDGDAWRLASWLRHHLGDNLTESWTTRVRAIKS